MVPHLFTIKGNKYGYRCIKINVFTVNGPPAEMYFYQNIYKRRNITRFRFLFVIMKYFSLNDKSLQMTIG